MNFLFVEFYVNDGLDFDSFGFVKVIVILWRKTKSFYMEITPLKVKKQTWDLEF